jgi:hypothetical protein
MSKKPNDINDLDAIEHRRRVRAMLSGCWRAETPVADEAPIVSETPLASDDDDEALVDECTRALASVADDDAPDETVTQTMVDERPAAVETTVSLAVVGYELAPLARVDLQRRATPRELLPLFLASRGTPKTRKTALQGLER